MSDAFNNSPLAQREGTKLTTRHLTRILKGMNADHASAEKSTANGIKDWKMETSMRGMGEDRLEQLTTRDLIIYLASWSQNMIAKAGGLDAWKELPDSERAKREVALMEEIKLNLFIWAGCCMHKDQNSFKAGNTAMMAWWDKTNNTPPIVLANKQNASVLRHVLDPAAPLAPMTEDETIAFEASTRGGVKAVALGLPPC